MTNIYLVKALRAYREVTYGQFDSRTETVVQETQDAAGEIERLNARIADLEKGVVVAFEGEARLTGLIGGRDWAWIKRQIEKDEGGNYRIVTLVAKQNAIEVTWEHNK